MTGDHRETSTVHRGCRCEFCTETLAAIAAELKRPLLGTVQPDGMIALDLSRRAPLLVRVATPFRDLIPRRTPEEP